MIIGQEEADSGVMRIGETVKLAYADQSRNALDPEKTIWEVISDDKIWFSSGADRSLHGRMSEGSIFPDKTSRRRLACFPEVSGIVYILPGCLRKR